MEIVRIRVLNIRLPAILFTGGTLDENLKIRGYIKTTPAIAEKENQKPIS